MSQRKKHIWSWGKVFHNFIGWVESANGKNSWVTSLSYHHCARDRAPKVLINYAAIDL